MKKPKNTPALRRTFALCLLIFVFCLLPFASAWAQPADDLFSDIDQIVGELGKISGLKPLKKIRYDRIDKVKVKQFLDQRAKEVLDPEEVRAEEMALKKFGLVPQDFDLAKATVDLFAEQAAAFYDFRKKKLFVIESAPGLPQESALVHELAHALADQHFNLEKYLKRAGKNDDGSLARLAVMEGQASWFMAEWLTRRTGQSLKDAPVLVKLMSSNTQMSGGQFPVFDSAPLYMRETLLFPYTQGMLFQHAVYEKLDQAAFTEVFRRPPLSTQQILHPEKYLERVQPAMPPLPRLDSERGYRNVIDGTVGELDHAILLRQYAGENEAEALAPRWKGGAYRLIQQKNRGRTVLQYASEWETASAATRFLRAYRKVLEGKWKSMKVGAATANRLDGQGDDGYFQVRLEGVRVSSLEGLPSPAP